MNRLSDDHHRSADFAPLTPCAPSGLIGMFDSGVGGLSVLRAVRARLPDASFIYLGDGAYAPYGQRTAAQVVARCESVVEHLIEHGARLIVVACNTATVLAIATLRARWPTLHFVGVEPGIKPAIAATRSRRIAVMATSATVASARVRQLIQHHGAGIFVHLQACPGLATAIENGVLDGPELHEILSSSCASVRVAEVDTVVLGCTHYPFVADPIRQLLDPGVTLIDTATAIAERVASLWEPIAGAGVGTRTAPSVRLQNTGATQTMRLLLQRCPGLSDHPIEQLNGGLLEAKFAAC